MSILVKYHSWVSVPQRGSSLLPTCSEKVLDQRFSCTALQAGTGGRGLGATEGLMGQNVYTQGCLIELEGPQLMRICKHLPTSFAVDTRQKPGGKGRKTERMFNVPH